MSFATSRYLLVVCLFPWKIIRAPNVMRTALLVQLVLLRPWLTTLGAPPPQVSPLNLESLGASTCAGSLVLHLVYTKICIPDLRAFGSEHADILQLVTQPGQGLCPDAFLSERQLNPVEAKNRLYSEALKLPCANCYLYVVFIDAEVVVEAVNPNLDARAAWALFHDDLFEWEPALAQPAEAIDGSLSGGGRWREEGPDTKPEPHTAESHAVEIPSKIRHSILAIHREAASFLLPYYVGEGVSETESEKCLELMAVTAFRRHVVQFSSVRLKSINGHRNQKPRKTPSVGMMKWAAESLRRLDDFLSFEFLGAACGRNEPTQALRRPAEHVNQYVIAGTEGMFDPCHELVSRKCDAAHERGAGQFQFCMTSSNPWCVPSPLRYQQQLLLFLQELFVGFRTLVAELDGFEDEGCKPHQHRVRIQISHPINSDVVARSDGIRLHGLVAGLPRYHGTQFDGYAVKVSPLDPQYTPLSSLVVHHIQGTPPVEWYCAPRGVVGVREFKWIVGPEEMSPLTPGASGVHKFMAEVLSGPNILPNDVLQCINTSIGLFPLKTSCGDFHVEQEVFEAYKPLSGVGLASTKFLVLDTDPPNTASVNEAGMEEETGGAGVGREQNTVAEFVYLVQSDVCIDLSHLASDRSEVIQLNWKSEPGPACPNNVYLPNSTLVQGRNRLYHEVIARFPAHRFKYVILMDGDATLVEVEDFGMNTGYPWRTFEDYLLEWEPAVGFPHFGNQDYNPEWEVQVAYNFDQIVVAYHHETAPLLLPYTERFDSLSWWYCASVQNALIAALHNDHRLQFNALRTLSWQNNLSPVYRRGANFLHPMAWIAPAITSLDALMLIPFFSPYQQAPGPNVWDTVAKEWTISGMPRHRGSRSYVLDRDSPLDFCHEYFEGRSLHTLCDRDRERQGTQGRTVEDAVVDHLGDLQSRIATFNSENSEAQAHIADFQRKADVLATRACRFECAVKALQTLGGDRGLEQESKGQCREDKTTATEDEENRSMPKESPCGGEEGRERSEKRKEEGVAEAWNRFQRSVHETCARCAIKGVDCGCHMVERPAFVELGQLVSELSKQVPSDL